MKNIILILSLFVLCNTASATSEQNIVNLGKILAFSKNEMLLKDRVRTQSVQAVKPEIIYDLSSKNVSWGTGYTTLFVGLRKKDTPRNEFLKHLTRHVRDVHQNFKGRGFNGYIFMATKDYEIAWLNWTSKELADQAFQTAEGKRIVQDAQSFMENGFYKQMNWTKKAPVKVLIVVTSHEDLGTTGRKTGFYLSEVTHPYFKIAEAGIDVDFASPQGGKAPMDEHSRNEDDSENKKFLSNSDLSSRLENTLKLKSIKAEDYSAVLFAGGHGLTKKYIKVMIKMK